jgi:hypothetical protein
MISYAYDIIGAEHCAFHMKCPYDIIVMLYVIICPLYHRYVSYEM